MTTTRGFSLIEVLIAAALILIAALAGVAYVTRSSQHADWARDKVFARQRAVSILAELRAYVEGGEGEVAADLDGFDDGLSVHPSLTITPDPNDPTQYLEPDDPVSGNIMDSGVWRWFRQITVRRFPGVETRDLRICTVRVFRMRSGDQMPGEQMAEVSSVIRTVGDAYPTTQVYDVYLLALENVPGWWVYMDAIQPFVEATVTDLESRNPGLEFRTHWITKLGFGRDEEYAPYTNETRDSRAHTPWTYVYPGRMPDGEAAQRYYVAERFGARVNVDGETTPQFVNDYQLPEPFTDTNGNGTRDYGETYTDSNGNGIWDINTPVPYALADMQNHCMRYPDADARFEARVAAGLDKQEVPTWRLLLDRMIAEPDRYHNAILINLHGELLPMPPARNYSDAAKIPDTRPGWRAVTHPELLRPRRVAGNDASSDAPRFRVYAYKTQFTNDEALTTQEEPFLDTNKNGVWDTGEAYQDWNGNGVRDADLPLSVVVRGGDFTWAVNAASAPSITVRRLPGGIDGDGDGTGDDYKDWQNAPLYPEVFKDLNGDGIRQVAEPWLDLDGSGAQNDDEPWMERDGDGTWTAVSEPLSDVNGNDRFDRAGPAEPYDDANGNGRWDGPEPYWDENGDGAWTPPTTPLTPWRGWDPVTDGANGSTTDFYIEHYGEPFLDLDGDHVRDAGETFFDANQNGVQDGGFERGEMWFEIAYDTTVKGTVLKLHGTPLETPYLDNATNYRKGLPDAARLYDLDYVPCPTPDSATGTDRFARSLYDSSSSDPKNTARWTVEIPVPAARRGFESAGGANDGDAADRTIVVETRFGDDLTTGVMWPSRHSPQNLSRTYAYYHASVDTVPFSERFQFIGDPRCSPYADTDRQGTTAANGYNWFWDNFQDGSYDYRNRWLAFDTSRLKDKWMGRNCHDVPRILQWLRSALTKTEAIYTTLTGFSYYYLSVGCDIGYDVDNGFANSIPMDGTPFGISGGVYENTITDGAGTSAIKGSLKFARSNNGNSAGIRSSGYWWAKPWIGELFEDAAYTGQWARWGNLRADTGTSAKEYHLIRRGDVTRYQQPRGTTLVNAYARLMEEGSTSLFNIGSSSSTFHHQYADGGSGVLVGDGPQLAEKYNFPMPTKAAISRPFGLTTGGAGGVGPEFGYTDTYPRFSAQIVSRYYNHTNGQNGSALVRLQEAGGARAAYIVVSGIDRTIESGSAFIARYATLSLIHSFFAAGTPGSPNRVRQLPRLQIRNPTLITELENPSTIQVQWSTEWSRWDGLPYTESYPASHTEDEADLVYVLSYSPDGGRTWLNMLDDQPTELGVIPWIDGVGPDPARTLKDAAPGANESWTWSTPAARFPQGSYLIRIEGYRSSESLHYSHHVEKIYVNR